MFTPCLLPAALCFLPAHHLSEDTSASFHPSQRSFSVRMPFSDNKIPPALCRFLCCLPKQHRAASLEHTWPQHRGGTMRGHRAATASHQAVSSEWPQDRRRTHPRLGLGASSKHWDDRKQSAGARLCSATRGLLGSILNAAWQIYAGRVPSWGKRRALGGGGVLSSELSSGCVGQAGST